MPHTPPPALARPPQDDEPDWYAMLSNSVPVEARHVVRTIEPDDGSSWTWRFVSRELRLRRTGDHSICAEVFNSTGDSPARVSMIHRQPFTATELWTLCVLVGLLPDRADA